MWDWLKSLFIPKSLQQRFGQVCESHGYEYVRFGEYKCFRQQDRYVDINRPQAESIRFLFSRGVEPSQRGHDPDGSFRGQSKWWTEELDEDHDPFDHDAPPHKFAKATVNDMMKHLDEVILPLLDAPAPPDADDLRARWGMEIEIQTTMRLVLRFDPADSLNRRVMKCVQFGPPFRGKPALEVRRMLEGREFYELGICPDPEFVHKAGVKALELGLNLEQTPVPGNSH